MTVINMLQDVIVHIFDISHPDVKAQFEHVEKVIKPMLNERQSIIYVANKCDLVEKFDIDENTIAVSCKDLTGKFDKRRNIIIEIFFFFLSTDCLQVSMN